MRRLRLALSLTVLAASASANAQPSSSCIDHSRVAFINGMWCGDTCGRRAAETLSQRLSGSLRTPIEVTPLQNPSRLLGFHDIVEAAIQSGFLNDTFWLAIGGSLAVFLGVPPPAVVGLALSLQAGVDRADAVHQADLSRHLRFYRDAFARGEDIVLVGHSQGNYFSNEAYEHLSAVERQRVDRWYRNSISYDPRTRTVGWWIGDRATGLVLYSGELDAFPSTIGFSDEMTLVGVGTDPHGYSPDSASTFYPDNYADDATPGSASFPS